MPKLVDHAQRRAEIIDATLRIVARDGLAGATMRGLAKELGVANGAVGHYFKNHDTLMLATYEEVIARTNARAAVRSRGRRGLKALFARLREMLPMDQVTVDESRIVVCFWGRVTTDAALMARLPAEHKAWKAQVRECLCQAIDDAELRADADPDALADLVVTTVHAMQVRAVMVPNDTTPKAQRRIVEQILLPWLATGQSFSGKWPRDAARRQAGV
jgi:AcrR family transcriptional regulator